MNEELAMASSSSSSSNNGVPPGFRFHPTDEELLLYYLKKKVSFEKFDLEVIREIDLNKIEPWELQERCRIGSAPQNEWYFFSHKDRKYPTGSRTNRATNSGFWKATGRDKCIRNSYRKIGMRKTLVFYRGRAPHGQKTDWIMHEYRIEETDDSQGGTCEDGWVVCRVFKKKCFFKITGEGATGQDAEAQMRANGSMSPDQARTLVASHHYTYPHYVHNPYHHPHNPLYYPQLAPPESYSQVQVQVQDLLTNHRPTSGFGFSVLPNAPTSLETGLQDVNEDREEQGGNEWAVMDGYGGTGAVQPMNQMSAQRGGEMDLWGGAYQGK
ncbi:hypothetical protein LUZ63_004976 [Rhynchospora breviuscula]|uniref:NAC domain-containing protein n=1 Tax=Rhynchospora breviuscula TaxID=2022672 RepID=A0A9Q0HS64_9POAL|nr:hypothetical protein LUZ63_004976 [Rhynchospora breviuscula]